MKSGATPIWPSGAMKNLEQAIESECTNQKKKADDLGSLELDSMCKAVGGLKV